MDDNSGSRPASWRESWTEGDDSKFAGRPAPTEAGEYRTLTYEVDGRIARITFNRPERGNAITGDTPIDLAAAVVTLQAGEFTPPAPSPRRGDHQ